jgi:aryl-alcohol dehydrogenase-like predicted oxidoreductase
VPYFPLGSSFPGFPKVADHPAVAEIAGDLGVTGAPVGLAWLLGHTPNTLLIPGTRSVAHLQENVAAGDVTLSAAALERLDAAGTTEPQPHGVEPFQR